jgi:DNA repair protein RadD
MFQLRPYQIEAIEALHNYICTKETNPCIVLPTGSGKSVVMAAIVNKWKKESPNVRGCILAHRKELVEQNARQLRNLGSDVGIFSAGLRRKDYEKSILFASIDSIYRKSGELIPFDFIFVDEAHRIPPSGEGKYRTFITGCKRFNKNLRVIGWTATPFRMGCGPVCHKDHILNEVCYEAKITDLINQGYLCNLRSKAGSRNPDLKNVKRNSGGDYITNSLARATNKDDVVTAAISEAVDIIRQEKRHAAIFFCVDIEHCQKVSRELQKHNIYAPFITSKTRPQERDRLVKDFRNGSIKAVCNVNVLTEGFDAPHIDCIVLLRPTLSAGLFSQMVGRGLRLFSGKDYCLVLDFGGCIDEHGPIDLLGENQRVVMATCQNCRESFSRVIRACPACGWTIPPQEVDRLDTIERERRMHGTKASGKNIFSVEPETFAVNTVYVEKHIKPGQPSSLRIKYRCGLSVFREWVCLDHPGEAGQIAQEWWKKRFQNKNKVTVNEALQNMFVSQTLLDYTKTITVVRKGKYFQIIGYNKSI